MLAWLESKVYRVKGERENSPTQTSSGNKEVWTSASGDWAAFTASESGEEPMRIPGEKELDPETQLLRGCLWVQVSSRCEKSPRGTLLNQNSTQSTCQFYCLLHLMLVHKMGFSSKVPFKHCLQYSLLCFFFWKEWECGSDAFQHFAVSILSFVCNFIPSPPPPTIRL